LGSLEEQHDIRKSWIVSAKNDVILFSIYSPYIWESRNSVSKIQYWPTGIVVCEKSTQHLDVFFFPAQVNFQALSIKSCISLMKYQKLQSHCLEKGRENLGV
jgi:hypothetical protein